MKVRIYSKDGCGMCDKAVDLCVSDDIDYEKVNMEREQLRELCGGKLDSYPQIFVNDRHIGNYFEFQEFIQEEYEPLLEPT